LIGINLPDTRFTPSLPVSEQLVATGGTGPLTWALVSGILPVGTTLSSSGVISGNVTQAGSSFIRVRVTAGSATAERDIEVRYACCFF
jgi:hypothetical protein